MIEQSNPTSRLMRRLNPVGVTVLVVEDHDATRRLVMELLRASGFVNLYFARHAEEAVVMMQAHAPDLLIVDWGLPGMSGIDLVTEVRHAALNGDTRFANPHMPIIMLTARQRVRDVDQAHRAGVTEFVVKPFSANSLLRAISKALLRKARNITPMTAGTRRKAALFPGLGQRTGDMAAAPPSGRKPQKPPSARRLKSEALKMQALEEMSSLRQLMQTSGTINPKALNMVVTRLIDTQTAAHDARMRLIEHAAASLNTYVRLFGDRAETDVLDVHLDALIRLNGEPPADHDEALAIVTHLDTLVTHRRQHRKVAS
ncbi:response regulator [Asticcacaulis sp. EMRT-3]|uniref:response regulator n=1 Tax=Asticcacaulis sp. EMRT-3 TaxID=3040349 RepID=UPI0024AED053|nr:response regulator [Asticcacaulis sp. EMRT-3]MDI7776112.1 response regulator [Asticcacaulis sp. EMRT-3]